jgi:hypothetical protein
MMEPLLLRRRDAAGVLAVCETVVLQYERAGYLTPLKLPGLRSIRYAADEVKSLVQKIRSGELA